ncbi:unnamed protein product [Ilex paraguariensis]|uniref:TF-B3 domain-containing protein n=1 Tax=Ilex paraguariensis TaxID=185542 RepID=A0ABC8S0Z2_9AQUA
MSLHEASVGMKVIWERPEVTIDPDQIMPCLVAHPIARTSEQWLDDSIQPGYDKILLNAEVVESSIQFSPFVCSSTKTRSERQKFSRPTMKESPNVKPQKIPAFFKVFIPMNSSERLVYIYCLLAASFFFYDLGLGNEWRRNSRRKGREYLGCFISDRPREWAETTRFCSQREYAASSIRIESCPNIERRGKSLLSIKCEPKRSGCRDPLWEGIAQFFLEKIPLAFALHMKANLPDKAFLRDCHGNLWPVEVAKIGRDLFFHDGWLGFVKDNCVELGDFLVFQFDGNYMFDFKLLGRTACEKKVTGVFQFRIKEEKEDEDEDEDEEEATKEEGGGEEVVEEDDVDDTEEDEDDDTEEDEDEEYYKEGEGEDEEESDEEEEVEAPSKKMPKTVGESSAAGLEKYDSHAQFGHERLAIINAGAEAESKRTDTFETVDVNDDDYDIFGSGVIARPQNPYFVAKLRAKRKNELYVPVDVIKDHNLKLRPQMMIRDPRGKDWATNVSTWKDGRTCLHGGWKALCKWNNLQKQDKCVCEFVQGRGRRGVFLQIHILRAGS